MMRLIGILVVAALVSMSACLLVQAITTEAAAVPSCHAGQKPSNDKNGDRKMEQCCQSGILKKEGKPLALFVAASQCVPISDMDQPAARFFPIASSDLYLDTGQHLAKLSILRI